MMYSGVRAFWTALFASLLAAEELSDADLFDLFEPAVNGGSIFANNCHYLRYG